MRIGLSDGEVGSRKPDLAACFAFEGDRAPRGIDDLALRRSISARMKAESFRGKSGQTLRLEPEGRRRPFRIVVIGLGSEGTSPESSIRLGCARAGRIARSLRARSLTLLLPHEPKGDAAQEARAAAEGVFSGSYRFDRYLTDPARKAPPLKAVFVRARGAKGDLTRAIRRGETAGRAVSLARDLVNEAPSTLSPPELARRAAEHAQAAGIEARVLGPRQLQALRMGALLAVARGSVHPPQVVHLRYVPPGKAARTRVVLVGKGVTFDSGGLDVKTPAGMLNMKGDMAGSAAVLAALSALPALGCRAEVHGLMGLVENMIGGASYKPGDILSTHAGKTVEVTNTDAEGRLVLCDLLSYAARTLKPDALVDLATLTGACVVALGRQAAGVFSRHDALKEALLHAGAAAGEKLWPMPMYEEYLESLTDGPADLRNSGDRNGGASIAALFLGEFVPKSVPWVHLDICGPAFLEKSSPESAAGATGAGVLTLFRWLEGL